MNDRDHPAAMDDLAILNPHTNRRSVCIAWLHRVLTIDYGKPRSINADEPSMTNRLQSTVQFRDLSIVAVGKMKKRLFRVVGRKQVEVISAPRDCSDTVERRWKVRRSMRPSLEIPCYEWKSSVWTECNIVAGERTCRVAISHIDRLRSQAGLIPKLMLAVSIEYREPIVRDWCVTENAFVEVRGHNEVRRHQQIGDPIASVKTDRFPWRNKRNDQPVLVGSRFCPRVHDNESFGVEEPRNWEAKPTIQGNFSFVKDRRIGLVSTGNREPRIIIQHVHIEQLAAAQKVDCILFDHA